MPFNIRQDKNVKSMDEGITIADNTMSIDYVGPGVNATAIGNNTTVTIPGTPGTAVVGETLTATGDPLVFTSANTPSDEPRVFIGSARVFKTDDYTRSGATFTFLFTPQTTPKADYSY